MSSETNSQTPASRERVTIYADWDGHTLVSGAIVLASLKHGKSKYKVTVLNGHELPGEYGDDARSVAERYVTDYYSQFNPPIGVRFVRPDDVLISVTATVGRQEVKRILNLVSELGQGEAIAKKYLRHGYGSNLTIDRLIVNALASQGDAISQLRVRPFFPLTDAEVLHGVIDLCHSLQNSAGNGPSAGDYDNGAASMAESIIDFLMRHDRYPKFNRGQW